MTPRTVFAMRTFADGPGAGIAVFRNNRTAVWFQPDLKIITLGEDLHAQQIHPFAAGIEVKRSFARIVHCLLGGKKTFKNSSFIFRCNPDPKITHLQERALSVSSHNYLQLSLVRRIFDSVFYQTIKYLSKGLRRYRYRRGLTKSGYNIDLTMDKKKV